MLVLTLSPLPPVTSSKTLLVFFLLISSFNYFSDANYVPIMTHVHIHKMLQDYFRLMYLYDCFVSYFLITVVFGRHWRHTTTCYGHILQEALQLLFIIVYAKPLDGDQYIIINCHTSNLLKTCRENQRCSDMCDPVGFLFRVVQSVRAERIQ